MICWHSGFLLRLTQEVYVRVLQTEYNNDIIHKRHAMSDVHGGWPINTLTQERNSHPFADDVLEFTLFNENY